MGYYTYYYIKTPNMDLTNPVDRERVVEASVMLSRTDSFIDDEPEQQARMEAMIRKSSDPMNVLVEDGELRWYDHDDDMHALAQTFPDIEFVLYGDGEESEDFWCAYYKGDKFHVDHGSVVYPPAPEWISPNI